MKKLFTILAIMTLTLNATAQDIYSVGYYLENNKKIAALYQNSQILFTVQKTDLNAIPKTIANDSNRNLYWMVNIFNGNSFRYTEVWKNNELYVTTEGLTGIRIIDIYCSGDTLYYAGHYTNDDNNTVATVWKGTDFTTHWQLGDGTHASFIYDAEVNPNTGIPYFCGYVTEENTNATVWEKSQIKYSYEPTGYIIGSVAEEISIDNDSVFTLGYYNLDADGDTYSFSAVWKNGKRVASFDAYDIVNCLCAHNGDFYYCYAYPHGLEYEICKNSSQTFVYQFPFNGSAGANKIKAISSDIYVMGLFENKGCIWKNFEVFMQPENCDALYDIAVFETSINPNDYYGFLCQPDSAVIELDPNSSMGSEYGDFQARFEYYPNGLLYIQDAFSINYPYDDEGDDYGHTDWFVYDSDLHVIEQHDSYYDIYLGLASYLNRYVYDDGLLIAFTIYYNDHHSINDPLILEDSISYTYDGLRRLQTEERFVSNTSIKNYEYLENEVIITTDGYTNGTSGDWLTLSREIRTFNEDSLLVSSQTEKYNDSTILITYGYDALGHRTSILTQKRNNGVWENQKLVQYHFNPNGRLTLAEIKLWHDDAFVDAHRAVYELNELGYPATVTFEKWDGDTWGYGIWQSDFYLYDEGHLQQQNDMLYSYRNSIHKIELSYIATNNPREPLLPDNSEWYYEILNDDGSTTYQHLEYAADTTIGTQRPKIIIRSNTQYDRDTIITEVTHEYIYEENGIVYWWNKDLEAFTMLYDLMADVGDEWEIKVGTDSLTMHVDAVENYEYDGKTYRMLHVSDENGLFSGNIVSGVGHLTSFFPERLMNRGKGYRVTGLRCYWVEGNLIFKINRDDCDAIYADLHNGIEEDGPSTDSRTFVVYPNPANNVLFVQTVHAPSLPAKTYRITNLMGQTVLSGNIIAETQQINIEKLPAGMYFINVNEQTVKFVVK